MTVSGFFILLALSIALRYIGNKLVPLVMPTAKLKTIILGWAGGLIGSLGDKFLWQWGPEVGGVYLAGAAIGCVISIILFGITPFLKIMIGKT